MILVLVLVFELELLLIIPKVCMVDDSKNEDIVGVCMLSNEYRTVLSSREMSKLPLLFVSANCFIVLTKLFAFNFKTPKFSLDPVLFHMGKT